MGPRLSLIIPTLNERQLILRTCRECLDYMISHQLDAEIIVIDDGSRAEQYLDSSSIPPGIKLLRNPRNLGKGGAVRRGVLEARGEMVIFTDHDLPFTLSPLSRTMELLQQGYDVVIGDRLHPDSRCEVPVSRLRRISSVVFTFLVNHFVGLPFRDTQCGYKGYRAEAAKTMFQNSVINSFAFEVETLLLAVRHKYRIFFQPLHLIHNETTSVRLVRHSLEILKDILRIKIRDILEHYNRQD